MKVRITEERECCQPCDLKPVHGSPRVGRESQFMFCIHCGRRHHYDSFMDGAGWDYRYIPISETWEVKP